MKDRIKNKTAENEEKEKKYNRELEQMKQKLSKELEKLNHERSGLDSELSTGNMWKEAE